MEQNRQTDRADWSDWITFLTDVITDESICQLINEPVCVDRGFDIGNHFCEWCYCYDYDEFPYFTAMLDDYPSREQQVGVLQVLLKKKFRSLFLKIWQPKAGLKQ